MTSRRGHDRPRSGSSEPRRGKVPAAGRPVGAKPNIVKSSLGAGTRDPARTLGPLLDEPHAVSQLQQLVGNGAVSDLVTRRTAIQRDDPDQDTPDTSADGLSTSQRNALHTLLASRTSDAFTKFGDACTEVRRQLRAERQAQVELGMLIIGTVFAFAVPGLGRGITALANRIPAGASTSTYRAALAIQDQASSIASAIGGVGKAGAKVAIQAAFASNADDYIYALNQGFSVQKDEIVGFVARNIEDREALPDENLWLYVANWDPTEITQRRYEELIATKARQFSQMIEPIGTPAVRELGGPTNLARSTEGPWGLFEHYSRDRYTRRTWVHHSMWEPAIRRSYVEHGGPWVMRYRGEEVISGGAVVPMYEWESPNELRGRYIRYAPRD